MDRSLAGTLEGLDYLRERLAQAELNAPAVSGWSVGLHIEHLLLVGREIVAILTGQAKSGQTNVPAKFLGHVVILTGAIPRGKGQAPEGVRPTQVDTATLADRLGALRADVLAVEPLLPALHGDTERFTHPVFGGLTKLQWLRLMHVHQRHHCAIIRDILKAAG